MKEVHNDVEVEPKLHPLTVESPGTALPTLTQMSEQISGFGGSGPKAVTHPLTLGFFTHTCNATGPSLCFGRWRVTRRESTDSGYGKSSTDPSHHVFSTCGGMGQEASVVVLMPLPQSATKVTAML